MPAWEDVSPYTEQRTRARRFSWTNLLIVLNLTGFVAAVITLINNHSQALAALEFDKGSAIGQFHLWQFVSYSFVQPINSPVYAWYLPWLILGICVLYSIGNELEAELGSLRYLGLYFACAAYGALVHALFQYLLPAFSPGLGVGRAATLCAPVLGIVQTASARWPQRPVLFLYFVPMRLRTALVALGCTWLAFAVWIDQGVGTSIGGVLAAMAIASFEPRLNRSLERAELRRERNQFLEEVEVRRRTDFILDKITREGMNRLTRSERRTLKQASQILSRGKDLSHE